MGKGRLEYSHGLWVSGGYPGQCFLVRSGIMDADCNPRSKNFDFVWTDMSEVSRQIGKAHL
jgi:hypothetical protein